jgi:DNA-binding NtrC family response regulator
VPPLRERPEDLPLLANHFLRHFWNQHREKGTPVPHLSDAAIRALRLHSWPGNVRELQNVFEHAVVIMKPGAVVRPSDIPFIGEAVASEAEQDVEVSQTEGGCEFTAAPVSLEEAYPTARDRLVSEFELRYLTALIRRAHGNMSRASRLAGIDRATLYRLMDKHGLQRESVAFGDE